MKNVSFLGWIALILVIIGGLNWGLIGIFNVDLVKMLFGDMTMLSRTIYSAVGFAAFYLIIEIFKTGKTKSS